MRIRAALGCTFLAAAAVVASAFEYTSWYGPLTCAVQAKVAGEPKVKITEAYAGVGLGTSDTTFTLGTIEGSSLPGTILKKSNTRYGAAHPAAGPSLVQFTTWVHDKILAQTGLDVSLVAVSMKGSFVLIDGFQQVKVKLTVTWSGTVVGGEHNGKTVSGKVKIKGVLPRD